MANFHGCFYSEWDIYLITKHTLLERYLVALCLDKTGKVLYNANNTGEVSQHEAHNPILGHGDPYACLWLWLSQELSHR